MNNNQGLTLLELVVAIAISSIVLLCVGTFVSISTRTSSSTKANAMVSQETQTAMNQLNRMVMEATKGIYVFDRSDAVVAGTGADIILTIYNQGETGANDYVHMIVWMKKERELYYQKIEIEEDLTKDTAKDYIKSKVVTYLQNHMGDEKKFKDTHLMANYMADFAVDVSKVDQSIVTITVETSLTNRSNVSKNTITLRNQLQFQ